VQERLHFFIFFKESWFYFQAILQNSQVILIIFTQLWGVDYKHSCAQSQAEFGTAESEAECSTAAFPKLFTFRTVETQVSLVTMSCLSGELLLHLLVYHWI
jgi:hypothetical protein